jgi:ubiquitin-conjugating enzyme E2 W
MKLLVLALALCIIVQVASVALRTPSGVLLSLRGGKSKEKTRFSKATVPTPKSKRRGWLVQIVESLSALLFPKLDTGGKYKRKSSGRGNRSKSMSQSHLEKSFKEGDANARIQKELRAFTSNPPDGCKLAVGANIRVWIVTITGAEGTIYAGEKYKLKIIFPKEYPTKPPAVYFLKPTPKHMHVYSNGDICLNLLGKDWRPNMTAQTLALSIFSMLSNAKEKKIPVDNAMHSDMAPGQSQENWMYHDDTC